MTILCFLSDIVVGYEETVYSTEEGDVEVEICVIIFQPLSGEAPRSFTLTYNTTDYTAGIYSIMIKSSRSIMEVICLIQH